MAGEVRGEEQIVLAISCGRAIFPSGMPSLNARQSREYAVLRRHRSPTACVHIGVGGARRNHITAHAATRSSSPTLNARLFSAAFDAP